MSVNYCVLFASIKFKIYENSSLLKISVITLCIKSSFSAEVLYSRNKLVHDSVLLLSLVVFFLILFMLSHEVETTSKYRRKFFIEFIEKIYSDRKSKKLFH